MLLSKGFLIGLRVKTFAYQRQEWHCLNALFFWFQWSCVCYKLVCFYFHCLMIDFVGSGYIFNLYKI